MAVKKMSNNEVLHLVELVDYYRNNDTISVSNALKLVCKDKENNFKMLDFNYLRGVYYRYKRGELKVAKEDYNPVTTNVVNSTTRSSINKPSFWQRIKKFFS